MFNLTPFSDYSLLFLRIMAGLVFIWSGWFDLRHPDKPTRNTLIPKSVMRFISTAEMLGGAAIIIGFLMQLACIGLLFVLSGAVSIKIFVWKTGFWGKDGFGWNYDLICASMLLVILCTDGGRFRLLL